MINSNKLIIWILSYNKSLLFIMGGWEWFQNSFNHVIQCTQLSFMHLEGLLKQFWTESRGFPFLSIFTLIHSIAFGKYSLFLLYYSVYSFVWHFDKVPLQPRLFLIMARSSIILAQTPGSWDCWWKPPHSTFLYLVMKCIVSFCF